MKIQELIEKKGYKITYLLGYIDGVQSTVGVLATKGNIKVKGKNITDLKNKICV